MKKEELTLKQIALHIFKGEIYLASDRDSIKNSFEMLIQTHMVEDPHYFDDKVAVVEFYHESRMLRNGFPMFLSGRFLTQQELDDILVYLHQIEDAVNELVDR